MAEEIELKLALPESEQQRFLKHPLLGQAVSRQAGPLLNLYYDTPDLALHRKGIALRLRRKGRLWLQTVKCAGASEAGLSARPEWETPYGGHFDFSSVTDPKVRKWLERPAIKDRIAPLFETNFRRITWRFEPAPGNVVLVMQDRGWIAAAGRREAISEVELELAEGPVAPLFAIARQLAERIALTPALLSKAERGYRIFSAIPDAPIKAGISLLQAEMPPLAAFRRIALDCLEHLQANHAGALKHEDPEYIHQMRVATRRLRAALRLFAPQLPAALARDLLPPLRELMALLGQARDLDVLRMEIVQPVVAALPDEPRLAALAGLITEHQYEVRRHALAALGDRKYGRLMLLATTLLHGLPENPAEPSVTTLAQFAARRLRRQRRKVLALAAAASPDQPASFHAVRIAIKRLRYSLEFFAPLMPARTTRRLLLPLAALQDQLGQLNDLASAGDLLCRCASNDARLREAVTLIGGWHGQRHGDLLARIPPALARLGKLRLPTLDGND